MPPTPSSQTNPNESVDRAKMTLSIVALLGLAALILVILRPHFENFPDLEIGLVVTEARDSTLSKEAMRTRFTRPAERSLQKVPGIARFISRTSAGHAEIWTTMGPSADAEKAAEQIRGILSTLDVASRTVNRHGGIGDIIYVYFTGISMDLLNSGAEKLKRSLKEKSEIKEILLSTEAPAVKVRIDGRDAVRVSIQKNPDADIFILKRAVNDAVLRIQKDLPELNVRIDDRTHLDFTMSLALVAGALVTGLAVFALLVFWIYREKVAMLGAVPAAIVGAILSVAVLSLLHISVNRVTLFVFVLIFGAALSFGVMWLGCSSFVGFSKIKNKAVAALLALTSTAVSFLAYPSEGRILRSFLWGPVVTVIVVLLTFAAVFVVVTPALSKLAPQGPSPPLGFYQKFLTALFRRRLLRIAVFALPQFAFLYLVLFVLLRLGSVQFFPRETSNIISVSVSCDAPFAGKTAAQLEAFFKKSPAVRQIVILDGTAAGPVHSFRRFGAKYAELKMTLHPGLQDDFVSSVLSEAKASSVCDLQWFAESAVGTAQSPSLHISAMDPAILHSTTAAVAAELTRAIPHSTVQEERDPDAELRRNGLLSTRLYLEQDDANAFRAISEEILPRLKEAYPNAVIEMDSDDNGLRESGQSMLRSVIVAASFILMIHIFAGIYFRSWIPALVFFSPMYLASGVLLFSRDLYLSSFVAVPFSAPVVGVIAFLFLARLKEDGRPIPTETLLDRFSALVRITAPLFGGLITVFAVIGIFDVLKRPIAVTFIAENILIAHFLWLFLPMCLKK